MSLRPFRARVNAAAAGPPLHPPATGAELEWWRDAKKPIRRDQVLRNALLVQVPVWLGGIIRNGLHGLGSPAHLLFYLGLGISVAALSGWLTWVSIRESRMRAAIIGKRLREGILNPPPGEEDPPDST